MGAGCACVVRPCPEGRCGCVADVKLLLDARTPPSGTDPEVAALGERDEIRLQTEPFRGEHATPTDQPPSDPYRRRREAGAASRDRSAVVDLARLDPADRKSLTEAVRVMRAILADAPQGR